jgi:hypothetical protein
MFNGELNEVMPQTTPRGTRIVNAIRLRVAGRRLDRHDLADEALALLGRDDEGLGGAPDLVLGVDIGEPGLGDDRLGEHARRAR